MTALNSIAVEIEAPDPQSLLALARAGDTEAYGELYRIYAVRLLRHAMALCGNTAVAEDLAQDTLVEAWKCLSRYNGRCNFFTWLCAILLNRYRNTRRDNRLLPLSTLAGSEPDRFAKALESVPDRTSLPDESAEVHDQGGLIRKCIRSLPRKQQQVIYLRFYVDDSLEGIAAALGCSVGTVKSRLFHALEKLRRMNLMQNICEEML